MIGTHEFEILCAFFTLFLTFTVKVSIKCLIFGICVCCIISVTPDQEASTNITCFYSYNSFNLKWQTGYCKNLNLYKSAHFLQFIKWKLVGKRGTLCPFILIAISTCCWNKPKGKMSKAPVGKLLILHCFFLIHKMNTHFIWLNLVHLYFLFLEH